MLKTISFLLFITLFSACGVSDSEKIDEAISKAHQLLTERDCNEALKELNEVGYQNKNPYYLSVYASAQACKSDFTEPNFFANDVDNIGTSNTTILGTLSTMSTSEIIDSSTDSYQNLKNAINTLLYAGGISAPSHANRAAVFGASAARNLGAQAFYMIIAQMGKYFYLHGNTDSNGRKGNRDPIANSCLADYTTPAGQVARLAAGASISPCASDSSGDTELQSGHPERTKLMCEGIVLFNNLLDILASLTFTGDNVGALSSLQAGITDLCGALSLGTICTQRSQSDCEAESMDNIELYFVGVFETMLTD